jgi:hypothetical protein
LDIKERKKNMSENQEKAPIVIKEGFEAIIVRGGIKVRLNASGGIDIYGDAPVALHPAANDVVAKAIPEIGDTMPAGHKHAGWIYAGISNTTHQPFYAASKDSGVFRWNAAMDFAARESARVPYDEELKQLYAARDRGALKGTFNVYGSDIDGRYCSATEGRDDANYTLFQRFDDGGRGWYRKDIRSSLRLVRD